MFELPEYLTLARQMNQSIQGKTIASGQLGNSPHKFVWYNRSREEFEALTHGKTLGQTHAKGRSRLATFGIVTGFIIMMSLDNLLG